jgi:LacI family transcriptional regulator
MPTIRDVASHAKVSVATVSHVINGTRFVDPQTVDRVQGAINALGYRPNKLARSLRRNETSTIGLLVPDNSSPFFAKVARTIEDAGFVEGYSVILCNSDGSETKEAVYVDTLLSKQIDGLILISSGNSFAPLETINKARVPFVVVDRELGDLNVDQVLIDNEQGGYLAGKYLTKLGHRRIGVISGPEHLRLTDQRLNGFRRALAEVGRELPDEFIVAGNFHYPSGALAMKHLIERNLGLTAVFAANDQMAIGAMAYLHRLNFRIPEDFSIVGYDDIPEATIMYPNLTTVAQPVAEIGRLSIKLLLERIRQADMPARRIVLLTRLIERESCAPYRA